MSAALRKTARDNEATAARWQAYDEQAQAGQCECCATGGHNDRPCIVCGHYRNEAGQ